MNKRQWSMPAGIAPDMMTTDQAAARLGLAPSTLRLWRSYGMPPHLPALPWVKEETRVFYRPEDVERFAVESAARATVGSAP